MYKIIILSVRICEIQVSNCSKLIRLYLFPNDCSYIVLVKNSTLLIQLAAVSTACIALVMVGANDVEYRLMKDLLQNYNQRVRPSLNASEPLNVTFGLALAQIIDVVCLSVCLLYPCSSLSLSLSLSSSLSAVVARSPSLCHIRLTNHLLEIDLIWLEIGLIQMHKQSIRKSPMISCCTLVSVYGSCELKTPPTVYRQRIHQQQQPDSTLIGPYHLMTGC